MENKDIKKALDELKGSAAKKKFNQTVDIIFSLKDIDLKKTNVDFFVRLHKTKGKKTRVCALVAPELAEQAKSVCDTSINVADFDKYQNNPKLTKKLADDHDFFIAQATIMPKVATAFGRVLGPRSKMPNPKAGCIVPPNANLEQVYENLQKTLRINTKKDMVLQTIAGMEDTDEKVLIDNIKTIYDAVIHHLPQGRNNIKTAYVKYTMSKPIKIM